MQLFPTLRARIIETRAILTTGTTVWSCGDMHNWWEPSGDPWNFWIHTDYSYSLESHRKAFSIMGYKDEADSAAHDVGVEKIALYIGSDGQPKHFARQKENGAWTSKLGEFQDIEHDNPEVLECAEYGKVGPILKRVRRETDMNDTKTPVNEEFKNVARNIVNVSKKDVDEIRKRNFKKKTRKPDKAK